jgi:hypothetical protein
MNPLSNYWSDLLKLLHPQKQKLWILAWKQKRKFGFSILLSSRDSKHWELILLLQFTRLDLENLSAILLASNLSIYGVLVNRTWLLLHLHLHRTSAEKENWVKRLIVKPYPGLKSKILMPLLWTGEYFRQSLIFLEPTGSVSGKMNRTPCNLIIHEIFKTGYFAIFCFLINSRFPEKKLFDQSFVYLNLGWLVVYFFPHVLVKFVLLIA